MLPQPYFASIFLYYLTIRRSVGYALVFLGMVFEGDGVLFAAAFLTHQGFFDLLDMFTVVFAGVIFGDFLWYWLGKKFYASSTIFASWAKRIATPFDVHIVDRPFHTIFISKFMYGFHHLILMRAGALGIGAKKLFKIDVFATILWMFIVGSLGFLSSISFFTIKHYLRSIEIFLLLGVVVLLSIQHFIAGRLKKKL